MDSVALPSYATPSATAPVPTGNTVTLSLGEAGQSTVAAKTGALLVPPSNPVREGYFFAGWYKDSAFTQPWNFDTDKVSDQMS